MWLKQELRKKEIIDEPAEKISLADYRAAFDAVAWTNQKLGGNGALIRPVEALVERRRISAFSVLDVGCGGGDVDEALVRWSRERGFGMQIVALDSHPHAVKLAKERLSGFSEASVTHSNFFEAKFSDGSIDIVVATLLIHHLTREQLSFFLWKAYKVARVGVVLTDLRRSALAVWAATNFIPKFGPKSSVCAHDAPLSIQRSYTLGEMQAFLTQGGYPYTVHAPWRTPFRLVLTAERLPEEKKV